MWYFGATGLDFNSGSFPPTTLTSSMSTGEGCTSIADQNGQLLFYSDGTRIWDNTHGLMPNANGYTYPAEWNRMLSGDGSSTQSAIVGPYIGNAQRFLVFTTDGQTCSPSGSQNEWDGLYYTIVNMALNGGKGDVDTAYIRSLGYAGNKIQLVDTISEKITLAIHANGVDYWVVALQHYTNDIYAFKVTCSGVDSIPVITPGGGGYSSPAGYMMASKDGKALAIGHNAAVTGTGVQYAEFNNNTGQVFNIQTLAGQGNFYGVCFSPNDSIIYATNVSFSNSPELHRFQRYAPSIAATQIITALPVSRHPQAIQKGPDGRMYIAQVNGANMSVLNTPNNFSNPGYANNVVPTTSGMGLPNFFDAYIYGAKPVFASKDTTICALSSVAIGKDSTWGWNYQWSPVTGLNNSTISNPQASPLVTTTYVASIMMPCDTLYDTVVVNVLPAPQAMVSPANPLVCIGSNILLSSGGGASGFIWSTGSTISSITVQPSVNSIYSLTLTSANGCTNTAVVTVNISPDPVVAFAGNFSICQGSSVSITASGGNSYSWSTGATTTNITDSPTIATTYTLSVAGSNGCITDTTILVSVNSVPSANAGTDDTICEGQSILLSATGGSTYTWSNAASGSNITVSPGISNTYSVTVYDNGCSAIDTVRITVMPRPVIDAGNNITIALGESTVLSASGSGTYSWANGSSASGLSCNLCQNPTATPGGRTTTYYLVVTNAYGCTSLDSVVITTNDIPCVGGNIFIPTAFSPNDDGQNDIFRIEGNCIVELRLIIYDRWGAKIFETSELPSPASKGWNGMYNGKRLDTDVFAYSLNAILSSGEEISRSGNVSLVR